MPVCPAVVHVCVLLDCRQVWPAGAVPASWGPDVLRLAGHRHLPEVPRWQPGHMAGLVHPGHDMRIRHVSPL